MVQMKKIAAGVGAAVMLMGYGAMSSALTPIATPLVNVASADAYMAVSNFTLLSGGTTAYTSVDPLNILGLIDFGQGNGAGKSVTVLPTNLAEAAGFIPAGTASIAITSVDSNGSVNTNFNGSPLNGSVGPVGAGSAFSISKEQGSGAFEPNVTLPVGTVDATSFTGGHSSTYGNALFPVNTPFGIGSIAAFNGGVVPAGSDAFLPANADCGALNVGDCVHVQAQSNVRNGVADTTSRQGVTVDFTFVTDTSQWFELSFTAEGFLRTYLGQDDIAAFATHSWIATVKSGATDIFSWSPNGVVDSITGGSLGNCALTKVSGLGRDCYEYFDSFSMNDSITSNDPDETFFRTPAKGNFEAELFLAAGRAYTFQIAQVETTNVKVTTVPEPGTLALLGLGLFGAGALRRRNNAA